MADEMPPAVRRGTVAEEAEIDDRCYYFAIFIREDGHAGSSLNCHGAACPGRRLKVRPDGRLMTHSGLLDMEESSQ